MGELGPDMLGDLNPGQQATSILAVASEPNLAEVAYDGYVVHMEVFDCAGPMPHTGGEEAEGGGGEGGAEHGGSDAEDSESGGETGAATGEEGSGANHPGLE